MIRAWGSILRVRLLLLVLIAIIPTVGLSLYTSLEARRGAARAVRQDTLQLVRLAAANAAQAIEGIRQLLPTLAHRSKVRDRDPRCSALLADLIRQYPYYANLGAVTLSGEAYCSALPLRGRVNVADRVWFQRTVQTQAFSPGNYQIGRVTGKATQNFGYPIFDASGQVQGVVFAALDLGWFVHVAADARLPNEAILIVMDREGTVLARYPNPEQWVGRTMPETAITRAILRRQGEGTIEVPGVDGVPRVYAFAPLGGAPQADRAYVAIGIPTRVAFAATDRALVETLAGLGLVALLAFAAALVGADRFVIRGVNALLAATARLSAGDLGARSGLPREKGEMGALARAFDEMAAALQTRAAEAAKAEATIRRYAERVEVLHRIDQAILLAQSPQAIAEAALPHIVRLIPCRLASLVEFDLTTNEATVLGSYATGAGAVAAGTRHPLGAFGDIDETLNVLRRGEAHLLDLETLASRPPAIDALLAEGTRYVYLVPLVARGELIGSFNLWLDRPDGLGPEHLDIAHEVAHQLAVALQEARMRARLQRHAAEMQQRISERTAALREAKEDADRANQAKSEFLSRMSHELRTPLNAVLGFAQLLEMDSLSPEQRESVGHILRGGRHLLELINEVLDLARIEAGRLTLSPEPVSVREVVRESLDLIRPIAAKVNVLLNDTAPSIPDAYVTADRSRLKQVLLNLLSNAAKYNHQGGSVTLTCETLPQGRLRIRVSDTGPGIPPDKLERLFIPFERLGAEQTAVEGTGLGLAFSKRLVEAMRGSLGVESTMGKGTTFWIELALVEEPIRHLARLGIGLPSPADLVASQKARIVLYIEDNLSNLKLVQRVLAQRPEVRVLPAMQGRLGLDLAREHRPNLILLDLHLPDISGREVLRHLQEAPETRQIPVVMISADATRTQIDRLLAAGARAYLTKPLDIKKFLALLDEILKERDPGHAGRNA